MLRFAEEELTKARSPAVYVPAGPAADYVVDRKTETILIGLNRGDRDATLDELQDASTRAMNEYFGN